jgi:hypothetical protein
MTFSGLCIGGPADGDVLECQDRYLTVTRTTPIPVLFRELPVQVDVNQAGFVEHANYYHHQICTMAGVIEFWLLAGDSVDRALKRLRDVYAKATHLEYEDIRTLANANGFGKMSVAELLK